MSGCPFHKSGDVPEMPARIAKLPVMRGFPVPWFVAMVNGEYDFRIMDRDKFRRAVKQKLCWVCGEKLGKFKSFVIGPMCGINRTNAEPPSHRECAEWSAKHCPFLSRPNMKRREDEVTAQGISSGEAIKRNPGCCAVWTVEDYTLFGDGRGGVLFNIGEPLTVEWHAEGREATRAEVLASIESGLPLLHAMCDKEDTEEIRAGAHAYLDALRTDLERHLPVETETITP